MLKLRIYKLHQETQNSSSPAAKIIRQPKKASKMEVRDQPVKKKLNLKEAADIM